MWAALTAGCGAPAAAPPADPQGTALARAAAWLAARQSPDGAWRSDTYATFRDGPALTPPVLLALRRLPDGIRPAAACDRAAAYLAAFARPDGTIREPDGGFDYPAYTAALAVSALGPGPARAAWLAYLRERQLTEALGWSPGDPEYGGWGYCRTLPRNPSPGEFAAPLTESNLSATRFAVEALRDAGAPAGDPAFAKARAFVERCQNYAEKGPTRFDDGGFFFIGGDPVRNKAGVAGTEGGRDRYASYGSATADGLRALAACGATGDRAAAAAGWLRANFDPARVPGKYRERHESLRPAVYFYYAAAAAGVVGPGAGRDGLAAELLRRQRDDGSWANPADAMRENDPVAATALAVLALGAYRGGGPAGR